MMTPRVDDRRPQPSAHPAGRGRETVIMPKWSGLVLIVAISAALGAAVARAQDAPPPVSPFEAADGEWLIDLLEARTGAIVAEIGAGAGQLTVMMARHVGRSGRVYSSELGTEVVQRLRNVVQAAGLHNVTVIEGRPDEANLPAECCDAVFMRYVYHHFPDPAAMNASLWRALKARGRLAVIDFAPAAGESASAGERVRGDHHGVTARTVADELATVGFEPILVETDRERRVAISSDPAQVRSRITVVVRKP